MIKHIIAGVATLLALWATIFMMNLDKEADRFGQIAQIIEKTKMEVPVNKNAKATKIKEPVVNKAKKQEDEAEKKLKALRDRAGNAMAFKVSPLYKQKCSSCHGVNGEGIIGPKLIGQSQEKVLKALEDFKSGKRKNYVMYGLLSKMSEDDLKALAKEIGEFAQRAKANH
jgi:cytochrome c553